jgi:hypothetical protein
MTTDTVEKKKPGFFKKLLIWFGLFCATIVALGTAGGLTNYISSEYFGFLFILALSVPFVLRYGLKKKWRKRNLYFAYLVATYLIFTVAGFGVDKSSPVTNSVISPSEAVSQPKVAEKPTVYSLNESFKVGYTRYNVTGIQWKRRLGNAYFGKDADSRYLLVNITVKNEDKENRAIPPFTLEDENGATYDTSPDAMYLGDKAIFLDSLNPGVQKSATLVFDVPPDNHYMLVVSGGFWSGEEARVTLN